MNIDDCNDVIVAMTDQNFLMLSSSMHIFEGIKQFCPVVDKFFYKLIKARLFLHLAFLF